MFVEIADQADQAVGTHLCIAIQQQHVPTARQFQPLVVRSREAGIDVVRNQPYARTPLAQHFDAAVGGCVVHHDHLTADLGSGAVDGVEAGRQQITSVAVDDDDRQVRVDGDSHGQVGRT